MTSIPDPRTRYLARARERALKLVAAGNYAGAVASLLNDLHSYDGKGGWSGHDLLALASQGRDLVLDYDRRALVAWLDNLK